MVSLPNIARDGSVLVALLGLVFVVGGVVLWIETLAPAADSVRHALFGLVAHTFFGGVILVLGLHMERSELPPAERRAVLMWCYGGFVLMFALSVWGHAGAILSGVLTAAFISDFVVFTSIGGAFGAIAGVNWGRARTNAELAEKNQEQQETLALLTRLMTHDVRHDMMVLKGHADLLSQYVGDEGSEYLDVIQTRTEETARLVTDAGTLVRSMRDDPELEPIDATEVLRTEVRNLEEKSPEVRVTSNIDSDLLVSANTLIHHQFSNLLQNAVYHNDTDDLEVFASAERTGDTITIEIRDNGVGIPPDLRETCFELGEQGPESSGDGIGLYLVAKLTEMYGGEIAVGTGPEGGAKFTITLPAIESS